MKVKLWVLLLGISIMLWGVRTSIDFTRSRVRYRRKPHCQYSLPNSRVHFPSLRETFLSFSAMARYAKVTGRKCPESKSRKAQIQLAHRIATACRPCGIRFMALGFMGPMCWVQPMRKLRLLETAGPSSTLKCTRCLRATRTSS